MSTTKKTVTIKSDVHRKLKAAADRSGMKIASLAEKLILQGVKKWTIGRAVRQLTLDGVALAEFPAMTLAGLATGVSPAQICRCCRGFAYRTKDFTWEYIDD